MVTQNVNMEDQHQEACAAELRKFGHQARYTNTGGGCMAVVVDGLPAQRQLTIGFANEGEAWVTADYTDDDGEIIAWVSFEVRPYKGTHGTADTPEESARIVHRFIETIQP